MLDLAGFEHTKENLEKAQAIIDIAKPLKEKPNLTGKLMSGVLMGALGLCLSAKWLRQENSNLSINILYVYIAACF